MAASIYADTPCVPLIIIQWTCDPLPYDDIEDTVLNDRLELDAIALKNSKLLWDFIEPVSKKMNKTTSPLSKLLNEDFNTFREDGDGEVTQGFFEYVNMPKKDMKNMFKTKKKLTNKSKPTLNPEQFLFALQNGTIIYLPIHGGHVLDYYEDKEDLYYTLPDNTYVLSFNPPNSQALFMCEGPTEEFLNFIIHPETLYIIANSKNRRRKFEKEFYNHLRIFGPGDKVINRGLITDRGVDLQIRNPGDTEFKYLKKNTLRNVSNKDIRSLYNELILQYLNVTSKGKGKNKKKIKN